MVAANPRSGLGLLVVWPEPELYVERLGASFPELLVRGATDWESAPEDLAATWILVTHGNGLTPELLARMPRLAWIQCLLSGTEHLAGIRSTRSDLLLTSCRGIHGPQMAEMALLHMLALSRGVICGSADRVEHMWTPPPDLTALEGKTVVIVGSGTAGARLARVCATLNMTVHVVTRTPRPIEGASRWLPREQLVEAAAAADYLVLALPYEADTQGLVGREVLAAMKSTARLVNIARGGVVDEPALIDALRSGEIAGAGLDVTATEPLPPDSPLWDMENVFLTPHIAGRSDRYNEQALGVVAHNLERYLAGEPDQLLNVIG